MNTELSTVNQPLSCVPWRPRRLVKELGGGPCRSPSCPAP